MNNILEAVEILRKGGLVAIPTETVYGLGADASNNEALKKIFAAKNRPMDHPLIVHIGDVSQLKEWAQDISPQVLELAKCFWPGPLTLILKKASQVSDLVTGGQNTVGLRMPNHPVALELLRTFKGGIAAPSANKFGRISPTSAEAVREELGTAVDMILDGGACDVGVESTILDMSGNQPVILRPGMITKKQIEDIVKIPVLEKQKISPRVSGSFESHYAPQTKTLLLDKPAIEKYLAEEVKPVAVLALSQFSVKDNVILCRMPEDAKTYAHDLYQKLRELDKKALYAIIIEEVPSTEEWAGISDRLIKASGRGYK